MGRPMKMFIRVVTAATAALLVMPAWVHADAPQAPRRFIVVLKDPRMRANVPADPDFEKFGGKVEEQWGRSRVVRMPEAALPQLIEHRAVAYIQLVRRRGRSHKPVGRDVARRDDSLYRRREATRAAGERFKIRDACSAGK